VKAVEYLGTRKGSIWKAKSMSCKLIIKTRELEFCTEA
jgi:hypothetical protein